MVNDPTSRADKIVLWLKNNPVVAPIVVTFIILTGFFTAWNSVPPFLQQQVLGVFSWGRVTSGWIFLGYQNFNDRVYWTEGPYAATVGNTPGDPLELFHNGNLILLTHDREVIIVNYKKEGAKEFYVAPPSVHGILLRADHTGTILKAGTELLVRDVWVGNLPGRDYAVWARVAPPGTSD